MRYKILVLAGVLTFSGCATEPTKAPVCTGSVVKGCQPTVYFDFNSAELNNEAKQSLDWASEKLKRWPTKHITIIGHADQKGTDKVNMHISEKRADAVRAYLLQKGIDANKISIHFKGKSELICKSPACQDINRRAESKIYTSESDWDALKRTLSIK